MSIANILDRLQINHAEIEGVIRSFRTPPSMELLHTDLPAVYSRVGALTSAVPGQSYGAGNTVFTRQFFTTALIVPALTGTDNADEGAKGHADAEPFIDLFSLYYLAHPQLATDGLQQAALGDLFTLVSDVRFIDTGIVVTDGPGGSKYWAVGWTLTIQYRYLSPLIS